LAIDQAKHDFEIAKITVHARKTQVEAAQLAVTRREFKAPIDGIVQEVIMHEGEWVNPGDVLMRIVRLDQLKVQGFVDSRQLHPSEVKDKTVTVDVDLARGRRVQFTGRIDYVSAEIEEVDDRYRVWATVDNRQENGHWVLSPGMVASMTIDVGALQAAERVTSSGGTR
jgi:multidrug efflux pump subunit AcrA (membrane-fusion protein)